MTARKGFSFRLAELEFKWILIGVAIGLALGYLEWSYGMDLIGTVTDFLSLG